MVGRMHHDHGLTPRTKYRRRLADLAARARAAGTEHNHDQHSPPKYHHDCPACTTGTGAGT